MNRKFNYFFIVAFTASLLYSCSKDTKAFKKVQYEVVVYPGNEIGITYNSDYNIENKTQKEIIINDANNNYTNSIWSAIHIQQGDEPYYIKVDYKTYSNPNGNNYGVFVFVNDTLVAQDIRNTYTPSIELTGKVYTD